MHFCNKQWKAVYNINEHSMHRLIGHFIFQEDALSVYRVYIWLVTAMTRFQYFPDGGQKVPHVDLTLAFEVLRPKNTNLQKTYWKVTKVEVAEKMKQAKKIFAWMEDKELNSLGEKYPG